MGKGDRYRIVIVIAYILLVICSLILLISIWNNLSLSQSIQIGSGLYFLVFIILILATIIFISHLLEERQLLIGPDSRIDDPTADKSLSDQSPEPYKAPFEVDIDELAEELIPRINTRESTEDYTEKILLNLARHFESVQGVIYLKDPGTKEFRSVATYAYTSDKDPAPFLEGEGIPGQVARNKTMVNITDIPEGYLKVQSGLGSTSPDNLLVIPLLLNKETIGIIELASFHSLDRETEWTFKNLAKIIGNSLVTKLKSAGQK